MGFVYSTWVNSHVYSQPDRERSAVRARFKATYVDPILSCGPRIVVLCSPDAPTTLHGHCILGSRDDVHWVYVAFPLRGHGYGKFLLTHAIGGYPAIITVTSRWPWASERFQFRKYERERIRPEAVGGGSGHTGQADTEGQGRQ